MDTRMNEKIAEAVNAVTALNEASVDHFPDLHWQAFQYSSGVELRLVDKHPHKGRDGFPLILDDAKRIQTALQGIGIDTGRAGSRAPSTMLGATAYFATDPETGEQRETRMLSLRSVDFKHLLTNAPRLKKLIGQSFPDVGDPAHATQTTSALGSVVDASQVAIDGSGVPGH